MIQRIQSIYLFIIVILNVICLCLPIGTFVEGNNFNEFYNLCIAYNNGTHNYTTWALFAILVISSLLALITIFLFKNRIRQIRFSIFNIILNIGYYATFITYLYMLNNDLNQFVPNWPLCLPFVCIILYWLAIRAIGKDEMLVKAYDRLR